MAGIYHKLTHSKEFMTKVLESGELWGEPKRNIYRSEIQKVCAYAGPLPVGRDGFEFQTEVEPDRGSVPGSPDWSNGRPGVVVEGNYAKIKVRVTKMVCERPDEHADNTS
jgi:hypothetical protein